MKKGASPMRPVHPGEVLREDFMKPLHLTVNKLALELHVPATRIGEIVHGRRRVTAEIALRLARYFHTNAEFWLNLQNFYDIEVSADPEKSPRLSHSESRRHPARLTVGFMLSSRTESCLRDSCEEPAVAFALCAALVWALPSLQQAARLCQMVFQTLLGLNHTLRIRHEVTQIERCV